MMNNIFENQLSELRIALCFLTVVRGTKIAPPAKQLATWPPM